jgi:hypothetical protein
MLRLVGQIMLLYVPQIGFTGRAINAFGLLNLRYFF